MISCVTTVLLTGPGAFPTTAATVDVLLNGGEPVRLRGPERVHLHLGPAAEVGRISLRAAHLPTGWVGLQSVLRLAVESFEVATIRPDWEQVLHV